MTPSTTPHPRFRSNPFATRWTQPGACPFLFPGEMTIHQLAIQLREQQGWGQIVGPHGSGKSTLLATLVPELERPPCHIACYRLHQGQRQLPVSFQDPDLRRCNQVIVDGMEQLSRWARYRLKQFCRRTGKGLLVTTHRSLGLPNLLSMQPNLLTAQRIVAFLQRHHDKVISDDDVRHYYPHDTHNLRELLFDLYDLFEQRRPAVARPARSASLPR
ncbi:MAG: hypothetical protein GY888_00870 [Planctomycetaceae bacterium]|nr:hypothetical protein [Planctomycetaceae bacterium]